MNRTWLLATSLILGACHVSETKKKEAAPLPPAETVTLVEFTDKGQRLRSVSTHTVVKSEPMGAGPVAAGLLHFAASRYRTCLHGPISQVQGPRPLSMRGMRQCPVPLRPEVRLSNRLAELLGAGGGGERQGVHRYELGICATKCCAGNAMAIWATSSPMVPSPLDFAIA